MPETAGQATLRAARAWRRGAHAAASIFDEDWWLDAAAPGAWDRVRVQWDGVTVGEMAFHCRRRWGLTYITMPHLTRTMSPRLSPPPAKPAAREMMNHTIVGELLAKMPRYDRFERSLDPGCVSTHGFVHANMAVTHMYTFRSAPGEAPAVLLQEMHQEARRAINKAQRECSITRSNDIDRFIRLHRHAYGEESLVDYATLERIFAAAAARGQAEIVFATLNAGADSAAMIVLWDHATVYTWLLARDRAQAHVGVTSLLTFEAMNTAHRLGRIVDLDGYVTPAVGTFLTKFGLRPVVRPYVNGGSRMWQALRCITGMVKPGRPDRHFRVG